MSQKIADWKCPQGHALGQVVRMGNHHRRLWIYRHAVDGDAEEPAQIDVLGIAEGLVMEVACDVCGSSRTWVPGEETLRELVDEVVRKRKDAVSSGADEK